MKPRLLFVSGAVFAGVSSISEALSLQHRASRFRRPFVTTPRPRQPLLCYNSSSRLQALPDDSAGNNLPIMDRHGFLVDAIRSTTTGCSSLAIAASTTSVSATTTTTISTPTTSTTNPPNQNNMELSVVCQNGALMGESAVPGAYSSPCMELPSRIVPLPRYSERLSRGAAAASAAKTTAEESSEGGGSTPPPGTIVVQQKTGGSGSTGMTVWNSGLLLVRLLDALVDELRLRESGSNTATSNFWSHQDVLELGCGTGLSSIAAHRLGARSVLATDGNPRVLELAQANIRRNRGESPSSNNNNIRTECLQWGVMNAMDYAETASFVIGSDLTYSVSSWEPLAETIATILKTENNNIDSSSSSSGVVSNRCYALYLSVGHDGFSVNAELEGFLSVAKSKGLVVIPDGVEGIDLSALLLKTLSDPEKKILAQSGGFRITVLGRKPIKQKRR